MLVGGACGPGPGKEAEEERRRVLLCPRLTALPLDQLLQAVLGKAMWGEAGLEPGLFKMNYQ